MKDVTQANVKTTQVALDAVTFVELTGFKTNLTISANGALTWVSVGNETPSITNSYKMKTDEVLVIDPAPIGKVAVLAVAATHTIYVMGS